MWVNTGHLQLLLLSFLISTTNALLDYYTIENGKVFQTCAYMANLDKSSIFYKSDPFIKLNFLANSKDGQIDFSNLEFYALIMGGEDMNQIQIGINPFYKVCDEYALLNGYCDHESDVDYLKKKTLNELIESNQFSYPIESFIYKYEEEPHYYKLGNSGIYCLMVLTNSLPENAEDSFLQIEWSQSYGHLLISDYYRMFTSFYFTIIYSVFTILLILLNYRKNNKNSTSVSIDNTFNNFRKKYSIQYKFILFSSGFSILYLLDVINYILLNKYDYDYNIIILPIINLISLSLSTLVIVWLIYNLLLLSSGVWIKDKNNTTNSNSINNSSKNKKVTFIRFISIVLIIQMLVYDVETSSIYSLIGGEHQDFLSYLIFIEYAIVLFIGFLWSILTSLRIEDRRLKITYSVSLVLLALLFSTVIFGSDTFSRTSKNTAVAYTIEFVFTLVLAMLWSNVVFENGLLVYSV